MVYSPIKSNKISKTKDETRLEPQIFECMIEMIELHVGSDSLGKKDLNMYS